jgi:phosphoribosylformylglycinamidine cyclo-ligase
MRPPIQAGLVKGMAHITGGGITENLPRVLPAGCAASVDRSAWVVPSIFRSIQQRGHVDIDEMYRAFNMGIGLILVCAPAETEQIIDTLARNGEPHAVRIGLVVSGSRDVGYV